MRKAKNLSVTLMGLWACTGTETEFSQRADNTVPESGVASLELSADELIIDEINYAEFISKSINFSVTNVGDKTLQLYLVGLADSGDGVFYIEEETDLALSPGISREFSVVATLSEFVSAEGSVRIKSNDSEYLDHRLPVYAYPAGWEDTGGSDDTGASGGEDTGAPGEEDTGSEASDSGSDG